MDIFAIPQKGIGARLSHNYMNSLLHLAKRKEDACEILTYADLLPLNPDYSGRNFQSLNPSLFQTSLLWVLIKSIGLPFYLSMLGHLVDIIMALILPKLNKQLVIYLEENDIDNISRNLLLASFIILVLLFQYFVRRISRQMMSVSEKKANSVLFAIIITKSLRLTATEIEKIGQGKILSILKKRNAISGFVRTISDVIVDPILAIISLFLLLDEAGPLFLAASGFALVSFLVSWKLTKLVTKSKVKKDRHSKSLIKEVTEVIKGIKAIKTNTLEEPTSKRLEEEFIACRACDRTNNLLKQIDNGQKDIFSSSILLFALLSILWEYGKLTLSKVYVVIALYYSLKDPLFYFQNTWSEYASMKFHLGKLEEFLKLPEKTNTPNTENNSKGTIRFNDSKIACMDKKEKNQRVIFDKLSLQINEGEFVGVIGSVGIGKSFFVKSIVNECMIPSGRVIAGGKILYLPHDSWIVNATLRDNIIMEKEFDNEKYTKILDMCQLKDDIKLLTKGDKTVIGSRGINLSGGQRQRIALARALYTEGDIYLFDDSLCQLDPIVAKRIFREVFLEYLGNKTRVFVTSNLTWLSEIPRILILDYKGISGDGNYNELHESNAVLIKLKVDSLSKKESFIGEIPSISLHRKKSLKEVAMESLKTKPKIARKVDWKVIKELLHYANLIYIPFFFVLTFISVALDNIEDQWPFFWCSDLFGKSNAFYAIMFVVIIVINILVYTAANYVRKSFDAELMTKIYKDLLYKVLHAPLNWHNVTESGVIITKLTQDFSGILAAIFTFSKLLNSFGEFALSLYFLVKYIPELVIPIGSVGFLLWSLGKLYFCLVRGVNQIDDFSRDKVTTRFQELLEGIFVIRSRGPSTETWIKNRIFNQSDKGLVSRSLCESARRWFDSKRQIFSYLVLFYTFVLCICYRRNMNPAIAVIVITKCRRTVFIFERIFIQFDGIYDKLEVCKKMFSFMHNIPQEKDYNTPCSIDWPKAAKIDITNLSLKYSENLPTIVKDLNLKIKAGEKVGIAGRTGSGKSTLLLGLTRLLEPYRDTHDITRPAIEIDDVDIEKIGLYHLRQRVVMIPQEPWLFSGTIRNNMNPEGKYTDEAILELFNKLRIKKGLEKKLGQMYDSVLDINLTENGGNLSQGEKQLLCIARALIKKPPILIMDEATANLDEATDRVLQEYIKKEMKESTVLMVAHRKTSIALCGRIINLSEHTIM